MAICNSELCFSFCTPSLPPTSGVFIDFGRDEFEIRLHAKSPFHSAHFIELNWIGGNCASLCSSCSSSFVAKVFLEMVIVVVKSLKRFLEA